MRASIIITALALAAVTIDAGVVRKRQVGGVTTPDGLLTTPDGLLTTVDGLVSTIEDEDPIPVGRRKRQAAVTTISPVSLPIDVTTVDPVSAVDGLISTVDGLLTTIEDELPTAARRRKRQVDVTTISPVSLPVDVTTPSPVSTVDGLLTTVDGLLSTVEGASGVTPAVRRKRQVDVTTGAPSGIEASGFTPATSSA